MSLPYYLKYILVLFVTTRVILSVVGVYSKQYLDPIYGEWYPARLSQISWLDIWSQWDSGWYLDIAKNGYSEVTREDKHTCCGQANYVFFPLYPLSIKFLSFLLQDIYVSAFVISNISLIIAAHYLYKLVTLNFDSETAIRALKYLFLFPTSFLFSGILSESLFLALLLIFFYYLFLNKWEKTGIVGFFLSLTRLNGFVILFPALFEYFRNKQKKNEILYLFLIPLGFMVFNFYVYFLTGDFFAIFRSLGNSWAIGTSTMIFPGIWVSLLKDPKIIMIFGFILFQILLLILIFKNKNIKKTYKTFSLIFLFLPLLGGINSLYSYPRYTSVIFPFFIILALLSRNRILDNLLTVFFIISQLVFMVLWSNGLFII